MATTIPTPPAFFHAILTVLAAEPGGLRRRDIFLPVADRMGLSAEQRAARVPSGTSLRYKHAVGWGLNMLKFARCVETPAPGIRRITDEGRALLRAHPTGFDAEKLRELTRAIRLAVQASATEGDQGSDPGEAQPISAEADERSPEERIDAAARELDLALSAELLERLAQVTPTAFEHIVLEVLRSLGYGAQEDDAKHVGRSGDGGIDGVISLDRLGFEKVHVQAKRWQASVGRPEVQAFFGALAGRRAKRGVIVTTSTFTKEAREFAEQVSETLVLLDGQRLAAIMVERQIGVTRKRVVHISQLDTDYFDEG